MDSESRVIAQTKLYLPLGPPLPHPHFEIPVLSLQLLHNEHCVDLRI